MAQKTNIQKLILRFLNKKKAVDIDDITENIATILGGDIDRKTEPRYIVKRTIKKLAEDGHIEIHETERSAFVNMTNIGRNKLRNLYLSSDDHLIPTSWDGKWRIVILDIPESDKQSRDALRYILKKAHFQCLKNSVWISPYPFEHLLSGMKQDLGLTDELIVIVTDDLDPITQNILIEKFL